MLLTTAPWSLSSRKRGFRRSGKTTVGKLFAERLGWHYQEGDALHPPENVAKMSAGTPLSDADRTPGCG